MNGRELKSKMDIVDAIEERKFEIAFMSFAILRIMDSAMKDGIVGSDEINSGMHSIFGKIADQLGDISDAVQKDVYEVTDENIGMVQRVARQPMAMRPAPTEKEGGGKHGEKGRGKRAK